MNRVKKKLNDRHNLTLEGERVSEHRFEFKEVCEIILTSIDNKQLFLKDGRIDSVEENDLRMNFDEFCNSVLIVGHLYY